MNRRPKTRVATTVLKSEAPALNLGNVSAELESHRNFHHHQVMVYADGSSVGSWSVKFIPDTDDDQTVARGDTGLTLNLNGGNSDMVVFPAALRGLLLEEIAPGTTGRNLTFIISSAKGPLVAP